MKRALCLLLALCMVFGLTTTAFAETLTDSVAEDSAAAVDEEVSANGADFEQFAEVGEEFTYTQEAALSSGGSLTPSTDPSTFPTMVLIDCGRGYYSVADIEKIIDTMSENHYDYLMLGFGNDGLRFVLDDMSVEVNGTTYASDTVKNAVISANDTLQNNNGAGQWTQSEMDSIISYATSKNIGIVPMLNCPGHAYAVYKAMAAATGITNAYTAYGNSGTVNQYNYSIDLSNETVKGFVEGLVEKYIAYFEKQGCKFFNFGCDESKYDASQTVTYLNDVCATLSDTMVPMAFCDVLTSTSGYPSNLIGIDWNGTTLSSSNYHFNANDDWYYVLGNSTTQDGWATYYRAKNYTASTKVTTTQGNKTAYGSILAIWNDSYLASSSYITNIQNLITSQATASVNEGYFTASSTDPTEQSVTVSVGGTTVVTTTGANNAGTYTTADPSIATVAVTGTDAVAPTSSYDSASNVKASSIATSTSWTKTSYYYKASDGEYYPVYAYYYKGFMSRTTTYYWGYSTTDSSSNVTSISNTTSSSTEVSGLYTKTGTDGTAASTTITFTGVAEGTTSVVIGGVKYNITVTAEDLSGVTPQTIHFYCSTFTVTGNVDPGNGKTSVNITASEAYGKDGVDISTKVPATGTWAYSSDSSSAVTVFWKGVKLTYANRQSATSTVDRSMSGVNYSKIRYYGGQWSVYDMDNEEWVAIASDDEVDAYYLQKTTITSEVTTYVKDWAYTTETGPSASGSATGQKALSFAVVYQDGQTSPATEELIYTNSTLIYWNTTQNMFIRIGVNDVYEVEKITYTAGYRVNSSGTEVKTTGNWSSTDRISWNKTTTTQGSTWYDETTCWTPDDSSEPVIDCSQIDAFSYDKGNYTYNDAILILIYLKPVTTEDSLTVKYVDDSNNTEFYDYTVNVANTSTEAKGTFLNRLTYNDTVIGTDGPWTSKTATAQYTAGGYLPDEAYVVNAKGNTETFQKDLTKIPALMPTGYASGIYEYIKAEVSTDGKTLTLHYNLKSDITSTDYVIDFGLSVNIPITDLVTGTVSSVELGSAIYGDLSYSNGTITYKPNRVLQSVDIFNVYIKYSNTSVTKTVKVYPATTVYYEEGFITTSGSGWTNGSTGSGTQTKEVLGSKTNNYGYDGTYSSATVQSNGTQATSTTSGDTATFDFTGTGIDLYGNLDTNDAYVVVKITSGSAVKAYSVIDAKLMAGKYAATSGQSVSGYNVPIYSIDNLADGTYTVTLTHKAAGGADAGTLNIDGFRVYKTLSDTSVYVNDKEDNPVFVELRDLALDSISLDAVNASAKEDGIITVKQLGSEVYTKTVNNTTTVDGKTINVYTNGTKTEAKDETVTAYAIVSYAGADKDTGTTAQVQEDLVLNGPKNEIYLSKGSTLTLTATTARTLQIGLKGVNGQATCTIKVGTADAATKTVSTVEMFYPVGSGTIVITNTGDNLLAVTKLKASDEVTISPVTEETIVSMLEDAGFEDAAVTADASLVLSIKTSNGKLLGTTTLNATGDVGTEVTFAKADIKAAVKALADANGIKLNSRNSYKDVTVAVGSSTAVSFYGSAKK